MSAHPVGPRGLSRLKGGVFPGSMGAVPVSFARSWSAFFAILVTFFFQHFFDAFLDKFVVRFSSRTCFPKSTKIDQKSMPRCIPMLTSFLDRFLLAFYSQIATPEPKESSPRCRESTIYQKIGFRNWHRFLIDFGANLARFGIPKFSKIPPKSIPRYINFLIDFGIDLGIDFFYPFWKPTWDQVGHFFLQNGGGLCDAAHLFAGFMLFFDLLVVLAPLGASWAIMSPLGGVLRRLGGILSRHGPTWRCLEAPWRRREGHLGGVLGAFWVHLGVSRGRGLERLGSLLAPSPKKAGGEPSL